MSGPEKTLRSFFFTTPAEASRTLSATAGTAADDTGEALGRLPRNLRQAVLAELGDVAAKALDIGLTTDIFSRILGRSRSLRRAATRTLADPDPYAEEMVDLVTYTTSYEDRPGVEIQFADLPTVTVEMRIELEVTVRGLVAVVRGGRLTTIHAGTAEVRGTLFIADQKVTDQRDKFDLPGTIRLRHGIPLADPEDGSP